MESGIQSVTFPSDVQAMGGFAFFASKITYLDMSASQSLTYISNYAFQNCPIVTLKLPSNVKDIMQSAFAGTKIKSIDFPNSLKVISEHVFYESENLEQVIFPADGNLQRIQMLAFALCPKLWKVSFPKSISEIQGEVFTGCSALSDIHFEVAPNLIRLPSNFFKDCVNISTFKVPSHLQTLDASVFDGCTSLQAFDTSDNTGFQTKDGVLYSNDFHKLFAFPPAKSEGLIDDRATSINENAFYGASGMTRLDFGKSTVSKIEPYTFYKCTALTTLEIPAKVSIIETGAFESCVSLSEITFKEGSLIEEIGSGTFQGCVALKNLTFSSSNSKLISLGERIFAGCSSLLGITLPDTVQKIGDGAFIGCESLTSIELINTNLTKIPSSCFENCSSLSSVSIPSELESVGSSSFAGTWLHNVTIPAKVMNIGSNAYSNCRNLRDVYIIGATSISESAFKGCTELKEIRLFGETSVGPSAFTGCTKLERIFYCGGSPNTELSSFDSLLKYAITVFTMVDYPIESFCGIRANRVIATCMALPTETFTFSDGRGSGLTLHLANVICENDDLREVK